ncbi:hypothetical protein JVU11DRAFT_2874 [Chiua virens]|nr:hypothetical protein JVU11DRAFT_2874 [Chiua virens]
MSHSSRNSQRWLKCHSHTGNQSPSDFLQSLFFSASTTPQADSNQNGLLHKHRHRRVSVSRNSAGKSPVAPSTSISTARSRRTSISRSTSHPSESKPSLTPLGTSAVRLRGCRPKLLAVKTHFRNISRGSTEALKLPSAVIVSGLELSNLPSQKAVLRTLAERKIVVSDGGTFGHDQDGLTLELPDGFLMVYVCRSDPRERPSIYKSLVCFLCGYIFMPSNYSFDSSTMFAMSSSVDLGAQTRLAIRQYRPPSSPSITVTSAAFPTLQSMSSLPVPSTPPVIPLALLQRLKHLCTTQARIRPPLSIYLADLFSATRHYGPLDGMMLTVRARQDAEALIRASRVLGIDRTGAELIKEHAERIRETDSVTTYPHSHTSMAGASSDRLVEWFDVPETREPSDCSSVQHGLASQLGQATELDVSEADIARIFPRVVSHRIRVRDSPFDEILSSAVCGAVSLPGNEVEDSGTVQWERETVKDILVHILAEV